MSIVPLGLAIQWDADDYVDLLGDRLERYRSDIAHIELVVAEGGVKTAYRLRGQLVEVRQDISYDDLMIPLGPRGQDFSFSMKESQIIGDALDYFMDFLDETGQDELYEKAGRIFNRITGIPITEKRDGPG